MFFKIAGFEFRYQTRQPIFWVAAILFVLLAFGSVASDNVQIGATSNVHKNAPWVIAQTNLIFAVIYMFVTTAFVANVIVRDDDTGYGPLIYSTRVTKFDYLFGRFTGAYLAAALSFLAVPLGILLGSVMPWVDKETRARSCRAPTSSPTCSWRCRCSSCPRRSSSRWPPSRAR
jgi:ABC-2 type transport system permease protein